MPYIIILPFYFYKKLFHSSFKKLYYNTICHVRKRHYYMRVCCPLNTIKRYVFIGNKLLVFIFLIFNSHSLAYIKLPNNFLSYNFVLE